MDILTRRRLLSGGIQAVAALTALRSRAAAQRISKMRFGFTSYQWGSDWDVPTTIANCTKAKAFGVELRTQEKYAAGVEVSLSASERREVKKRFADSPVALVGLACSERYDWLEPAKLNEAIESTKGFVKLSQDVGGHGLRVFVNDFHKEVPHEKTIEQVAGALNTVGKYAADYGQLIRLENHGSAGDLVTIRKIMDGVNQSNVRIKLNGDPRDSADFAHGFQLVKNVLDDTLHFHELNRGNFPYQLQADLLIDAGWEGWWLLEASSKVPDRVQALIEQHQIWDGIVAKSLSR
ncbi:MAG: TIM barrel protein [Bryobacteraceae bacterium]|jgi:hypothetical protein